MSIAVFDKFVNGIPTSVFDGKDVSMVLLVDPPAELPPFFLANKGVLDTASKTIKVYDDTGNTVVHNFDIAGTDLTPINEAIAGLESRVGDNETDIGTLQGDVSTNTNNIGTNTSNIGDLQGRTTALESTTSKHTTDIQGLQGATGTNASDISALTLRVGKNETDIAAVVITANAADTLSKQNKERLDNLPEPPSLEGYIKTGDDATLKSVSFGDNTKIDTQPDLGLVLQGDYIYGKADSGYEHFFVESGNFNVKSKKIQKVNDGQAEDDAVNLRQLGAVESKADAAQTTANAADTLSKSNQTAIGNLSTTVGNNTSSISTNAKDISDLSTKVDGVESTANAADTLSKSNKDRLDGLPADVTPRVEALEANALQKDVNGYDAKSFKILNVASGEDTDSSAANIGDVKRISTEGSGLKPTNNEWDMLTYPVTNIGTSDVATSAATVGQVNAVAAQIPNTDNFIQTGTTATLNAVMFGGDTKVDYQTDLGLVLQGDTIYGKSQSGYEHFFIEDGNFNVKSKKIQKVRDGVADDDAATVRQVNTVDGKVDSNASAISNLSTTVGQHDTQIGTNTSDIAAVTTTANNADTLSKDNKTRLDNLPPTPDLSGYVKNGDNVNFGTADINIVKVTKGDDHSKFSDILIDGNTNTQMNFVGDTHFYVRNKADNTKGSEVFQIDSSGNFNVKQKIKTPVITNPSTGTTNSNTDKAGFIDFTQDNEVKLGAKSSVLFALGGNISAGVYNDHVNFNVDYVTGVKMREEASRQPYDAVNWETLQGFTPSLEGYAKLGTAVNFADVTIDANGTLQSPTALKVRIDGSETISFDKSAIYPKNNIVMGNKQITGLSDGGGADHAVNKGQLDTVSHKISDVRSTSTWTHFTFNGHTLQDYFNGIGDTNEEKRANFLEACAKAVDTRKGNSTSWEAVKIISSASPDWDTGSEIFPRYGTWVFRRKGNTARNELTWFNEHQTKRLYGSISTTGVFGGWIQAANQFSNAEFEDITASNLTLSSDDSIIKGNSTGTLIIQNADSIRRNHTNDSNSVTLGVGNNVYKSDIHHFKNNDGDEQFKIQNDSVSVKDKRIVEVGDGTAITDAVNMRLARIGLQSNTVNIGGLDHLTIDGQTLEYWMNNMERSEAHTFYNRIRRARPISTLGGASHNNWICHYAFDQNSAIWNFLPSSVAPASGHMQILHEADLKTRWVLWVGEKIILSKSLTFNIGTGASGQPDTAFGIFDADGGGNNPAELDGFKKYYQISSPTTYYSHQGDNHLYIDWSGNGGNISLDTMRRDDEQQEDMVMVHNKSDYDVGVRCFYDGSSVLYTVPPKSFIQAWTNRTIGRWVAGIYKDPSFIPDITVVKADDIEWTTSSDPRTNTQRLIAAAPSMCTIIGRHVRNGSAKQNIISVGDSNRIETQTSTYVIHKHSSGHATGMCTSEETSGKTWSRILDGKRNAWFTNESANSRMASGEIDPTQYPEDQIFFTTDQGIMETYFDEEADLVKLRVLEGYNVPKHESDIAALEVQTEKNRSQTHYFINEGNLSYDWPDEARRPLVEVQVLNTMQTINNSSVTVTDNDTHRYSGTYNSVGAVAINSSGNWSVQYVYHNAYKKTDQDWYVVFNQGNASWQIIEAANPHTSVGSTAASITVQLGGQTSLPESFGNYTIDPNFDNIDSLEFLSAEVPVQYDDINSRVLINFNGAKPSGYVVLK